MNRVDPTFRYPPPIPAPKTPDRALLIGLGLIVLASLAFVVLCVFKALHG
ncbi:hypothetical protein PY254_10510 [Rhodanobacter sp. AS-Z3]|nr:hypothetical protein [Rhodanobacter sp. AS-Z3]WEN13678.1 hypothetical protein PY254_10510 [Rhodanobacter sp. AS-Z3]